MSFVRLVDRAIRRSVTRAFGNFLVGGDLARSVLDEMATHYCDRNMYEAGAAAIVEYTGCGKGPPHICDPTALAEVTFRAMMKAAAGRSPKCTCIASPCECEAIVEKYSGRGLAEQIARQPGLYRGREDERLGALGRAACDKGEDAC